LIIPGAVSGCSGRKDPGLVRLGFIGLGRQAMYLMDGFIRIPGVEVLQDAMYMQSSGHAFRTGLTNTMPEQAAG
jgi:hypothetical protein